MSPRLAVALLAVCGFALCGGCRQGAAVQQQFYQAVGRGDVQAAERLLKGGADPNRPGPGGLYPLQVATLSGRVRMMKLLLEHGAATDVRRQSDGWTPLHMAAMTGGSRAAQVLVEAGADVNARSNSGVTPLAIALSRGAADVARLLERHGACAQWGKTGPAEMVKAAGAGRTGLVEHIFQSGVDLDCRDSRGLTPLIAATMGRRAETARWLLDHGVDPAAADSDGFTALHFAAYSGDRALVERLISLGVAADAASKGGVTPLHLAAFAGQLEVARTLVSLGADVNAATEVGVTPAALAQCRGPQALYEFLVEHGAQVRWGECPWAGIFEAVARDDVQGVKEILEQGTDVNQRALLSITPLHAAVRTGDAALVRLLLERGADPNAATAMRAEMSSCSACPEQASDNPVLTGRLTPLHFAVEVGDPLIVSLLLDHGASIELKTTSGLTPLDLAERLGRSQLVQVLRSHRPEPPAADLEPADLDVDLTKEVGPLWK